MGYVLYELEDALRAKGDMTRLEEYILRASRGITVKCCAMAAAGNALTMWFGIKWVFAGNRWAGLTPGVRFSASAVSAMVGGLVVHDLALKRCATEIFDLREERMNMELAKIILTKHSNDKSMVEAVKRHFFPEQVFDDLHQHKPFFRWRPRHSYVDSIFLERTKEIEDIDSDDNGNSSSGQTTGPLGDLMEDPLQCILGSPGGDMEISKPLENTGTLLKRREMRAHRRAHRLHHRHSRHADKIAAV